MVHHYTDGDEEKFKEMIGFSLNYIYLTTLPLMVMIIVIAKNLIPIFLPISDILIALAPCLILTGLANIFGVQILMTVGRNKVYAVSVIIGAVISFIVNSWLAPIYKVSEQPLLITFRY